MRSSTPTARGDESADCGGDEKELMQHLASQHVENRERAGLEHLEIELDVRRESERFVHAAAFARQQVSIDEGIARLVAWLDQQRG